MAAGVKEPGQGPAGRSRETSMLEKAMASHQGRVSRSLLLLQPCGLSLVPNRKAGYREGGVRSPSPARLSVTVLILQIRY